MSTNLHYISIVRLIEGIYRWVITYKFQHINTIRKWINIKVDVLIIGGGGGAYPGGFKLAESGKSVLMADPKGVLGGNCLYLGCIPSKTLRELIEIKSRGKRLLNFNHSVDFRSLQEHKDKVQQVRFEQHKREMSAFKNLTFIKGTVKFTGEKSALITSEGGQIDVEFDFCIIATGTVVSRISFPGSDQCITSDDVFRFATDFRYIPKKMVIVGGGYIALEVASMFHNLGTEIHLFVRTETVLRNVDRDLVKYSYPLITPFRVHLNTTIKSVSGKRGNLRINYTENGVDLDMEADEVLLAVGRKGVIPEGIELTGIKYDPRGIIEVSETMRTSVPHIFATGDITGKTPYFHAAVRESIVAANNIIGRNEDKMNFTDVPVSIFTFPPISYVGILRNEAKRMGMDIVEISYALSEDSRAQMYEEQDGEIRLFVERSSGRIVGGWVVGINAPELINEIGTAVFNSLTVNDVAKFPDQHPTTNEGISKAARKLA
ncbi:dihydrolipoyl dehydrogenase [Cuniculiplasma sp. SKW3]|uniref:dihydrolipoyl dehydrogenase n=1 Tax=Cuniculiplasma sp. SKW3 TaxID=3400170 RepID=UPI003FD0DD62